MFYEQFLKLCNERGFKPTPVIKQMGLSSGNLKRWKNGAVVNSETLEKCAVFFGVPVGYFFKGEVNYINNPVSDNANDYSKVYCVARDHPEIIASISNGSTISVADLNRLAKYLCCRISFLVSETDECALSEKTDGSQTTNFLSEDQMILDILGRVAVSKSYHYLQVQLSRLVVANLEKLGFTLKDVLALNIAEKKTRELFDRSKEPAEISPFTCSDIFRIANGFKVGITYLFTGR